MDFQVKRLATILNAINQVLSCTEGWNNKIKLITSEWVKSNNFNGTGTIWSFGSQRGNFHRQNFSMFYAVLGMTNEFRVYLASEISQIFGENVRPNSDYLIPNPAQGWDAICQIESGKVWEEADATSWREVRT